MKRRGFTLIELLVVIFVIAVLVALLLAAVQAAREAVRRASCVNNMKQIMLAAQLFHDANNTLPPGASPSPSNASLYVDPLPYLEQKPRYDAFNFSFDFTGKYENQTARAGDLSVFMCPLVSLWPNLRPWAWRDSGRWGWLHGPVQLPRKPGK